MRWISTQCDDLQRSFCELVELKTSLTFTSFIYLIESLTTFPFKSMSTELPLYLSLIIRLPHIRDEHSQTNFVISVALAMAVAFIHCSSNDIMYIFIAVKSTTFFRRLFSSVFYQRFYLFIDCCRNRWQKHSNSIHQGSFHRYTM